MATKWGTLAARIIGCQFFFIPDGTNIGTVEAPEIIGVGAKPADDADWADFSLGRMTSSAYDPTTKERTREFYSPEKNRYIEDSEEVVSRDAFNATSVDIPAGLYDQLMFGLNAAIVDGTPQAIFANAIRSKKGWIRFVRYDEEQAGLKLHVIEFHGRLGIGEAPDDSSETASVVWRIEHLGDAASALEEFTHLPEEV